MTIPPTLPVPTAPPPANGGGPPFAFSAQAAGALQQPPRASPSAQQFSLDDLYGEALYTIDAEALLDPDGAGF